MSISRTWERIAAFFELHAEPEPETGEYRGYRYLVWTGLLVLLIAKLVWYRDVLEAVVHGELLAMATLQYPAEPRDAAIGARALGRRGSVRGQAVILDIHNEFGPAGRLVLARAYDDGYRDAGRGTVDPSDADQDAAPYSPSWRTVDWKLWLDFLRLALLLIFAVTSSFLASPKATFSLLAAWLLIPCIAGGAGAVASMRLNDFPWFILFPLLASLLPVAVWAAHGLVLPLTSIGPLGMRKRFLKVYAIVGLGLTLVFGVQYLILGLSM